MTENTKEDAFRYDIFDHIPLYGIVLMALLVFVLVVVVVVCAIFKLIKMAKQCLDHKEYKRKVKKLKPELICTEKHEKEKTFLGALEQSKKAKKKIKERQKKQQIYTNNTINCEHEKPGALQHCLKCLLNREYGESHLFKPDKKEALFIPSFFVSRLYGERTSVLDHNIKLKIEQYKNSLTSTDSLNNWLKEELSKLLEALDSKQDDTYHLDPMEWVSRMKVLYLMHNQSGLPSAVDNGVKNMDLDKFIEFCLKCLPDKNETKQEFEKLLKFKRNTFLQTLKDKITSKPENQKFKCDKQSEETSFKRKLDKLSQKKEDTPEEESLLDLTRDCAKYCKSVKKEFDKYLKNLKKGIHDMVEKDGALDNSNFSWLLDQKALSDVFGEEVEYFLYHQLKDMKEKLNNFVIIHSLELAFDEAKGNEKDKAEFDFLLFSAERKVIIAIEAKRSLYRASESKYDLKAFNQLKEWKDIFERFLGDCFEGGKEWNFIPMIFTFNERDCKDLPPSSYVVSKSKLTERLKTILADGKYAELDEPNRQEGSKQLKQVLSLIIFVFHISKTHLSTKGVITPSKWVNYTMQAIDAISTIENIIFYSTSQLPVFMTKDNRNKEVIIVGEYGSGKSLLLKEKANLLLKENEDVLYLFGNKYKKKTLQHLKLEKEWEGKTKIEVMNVRKLMGNDDSSNNLFQDNDDSSNNLFQGNDDSSNDMSGEAIAERLKRDHKKNIFIDELNLQNENEVRIFCDAMIDTNKYVWITFTMETYQKAFKNMEGNKELGFVVLELGSSMRNTKKVVRKAKAIHDNTYKHPELTITASAPNFIEGEDPISNSLITILKMIDEKRRKEQDTKGVLFIAYSLPGYCTAQCYGEEIKSPPRRGFRVGIYINEIDEKVPVSTVSESECLSFLENKENILITDSYAAEGFEWPNVITVKVQAGHDTYTNSLVNRILRGNSVVYLVNTFTNHNRLGNTL